MRNFGKSTIYNGNNDYFYRFKQNRNIKRSEEPMMWNETMEALSADEMHKLQSIRLKRVVEHVYANTPFYRKKMME
ncbi:MAG: hypothetical protein PHX49_03815, partial [Bacteroidales bacterium]|nr:hypothetical protein [Bacteroidales bacterium]